MHGVLKHLKTIAIFLDSFKPEFRVGHRSLTVLMW